MKKAIIKNILFIVILVILWNTVFKILWMSKNSIYYSYKEPINSIDVVYVGSSNVLAHFNPVLAYNIYGYSTSLMSSSSQPFQFIKYLIKESKKYQKPKVYVIDIAKVADDMSSFGEGAIRGTVDSMRFSKNRFDAINEMLKYKNIDKSNYINYHFSFLLYHNKWSKLRPSDILGNRDLFKGFLLADLTIEVEPQQEYVWNDKKEDLPQENQESLLSLIEYIKENKLNVLFAVPKKCFEELSQSRINTAISIIKENDFKVINFNTIDELNNINFETDFYNPNHLNIYGATKFTLYFAKYLKENYDLPDHKMDLKYNSWEREYIRFKNHYKELTNKNFDDLLKENY